MQQTVELLSILYELSLSTHKHLKPEETAKSFLKKIISRRSLQAGSVWEITQADDRALKLQKIYAIPETKESAEIDLHLFRSHFLDKEMIILDHSLISEKSPQGKYAYFKLNDFGLMELFYSGSTGIDFSYNSFLPYMDVISQFGVSLESGFFYFKLQDEIDQRIAAERSLKNNEEKYRRIIDNIKMGLLEVDTEEKIQYANRPFLDLTGYSLEDLKGKNASDLFLDEEQKEIIEVQNRSRARGESTSYELKIKDKDGKDKWLMISGSRNYDKDGEIIGSIGIHLDITEQKLLRLENEFKTIQLEKLFEKSLDGLISINAEGEVFEWSPQAEKIFGYTKKDMLGKKLSDTIVPHQHRAAHKNGMENYLATGHGPVLNNRIEIIGLNKKGEVFPIELTIFPLKYKGDMYFTAFVRDITEIKKSQQNMEQALERQKELNSMKSKFISMTSHELRTPLTTIKSNTELLNYQLEHASELKPEKLGKNVSRIESNVERLNNLINNILMIGKLDSEKIPFDPRLIEPVEFIEEAIMPDFESRNQKIIFSQKGAIRPVQLDPKLFTQIISNLIENAIKYTPEDIPPEIKVTFGMNELVIEVVDYGIGIPKDELGNLFSTFFRASNVDNIQGTGLGLSIVSQFVKIHGGSIHVESEVGKGSTFIVNFPYTQIIN